MRRGYKGRQTGYRKRSIRWGRFLLFLALLVALAAAVLMLISLLSPDEKPFSLKDILPSKTQAPQVELPNEPAKTPVPESEFLSELAIVPVDEANPSNFGFRTDLMISGEEAASFLRSEDLSFKSAKEYTKLPGILTFGGNNYRNTFVYGTQSVNEKKLTRIWEADLGSLNAGEGLGTWTGTGWTGMPIIVEWPEKTRRILGIKQEFKDKEHFIEVIYPAMDGYIHFLELESGRRTREPLKLGVVTKGTASLDPRGYPLLYTGQGIPDTRGGSWFRIIDLIKNEVIWKFGGVDPFAHRKWQAYDSSALINAAADTLIAPGENGVIYTVKLNSVYDETGGKVSVNPGGLEKYRYIGDGYGVREESDKRWLGIENSAAAFRNYAFFTDNGGRLQCLDLNTLELKYVVDVTDDSDVSIVLEEDPENNTFYLYTANEVDKQSGAASSGGGKSYHRKIDGPTGRVLWQNEWDARYGSTSSNGGTLGTPHSGRGKIKDLVIFNATLVPVTYTEEGVEKQGNGGSLIAYDKQSGREVWRFEQYSDYWSSPVVIYDLEENAYILQGDRNGRLRMHDSRTGKPLFELDMGSRMESTPAVFGDYLVVGTRGTHGSGESQKIIGVKIS